MLHTMFESPSLHPTGEESIPNLTGMAEHMKSNTGQMWLTAVYYNHIYSQSEGGGHHIPCTATQSGVGILLRNPVNNQEL